MPRRPSCEPSSLDIASGDTRLAFARLVGMNQPDAAAELLAVDGHALLMRGEGAAIQAFARRYPQVVEAHPATWFFLAMERWFSSDVDSRHALDRSPARAPGRRRGESGPGAAGLRAPDAGPARPRVTARGRR